MVEGVDSAFREAAEEANRVRDDALHELAAKAVVTPEIGASEAFAILVDMLLEAGLIQDVLDEDQDLLFEDESVTLRIVDGGISRRPDTTLEQAWKWAHEATDLPLIERMTAEWKRIVPPWLQGPNLETANGVWLDTIAAQLFGVQRLDVPTPTRMRLETDTELRERCRTLLRRLSPAAPPPWRDR